MKLATIISKTSIPDDITADIKAAIINVIKQTYDAAVDKSYPKYLTKKQAAEYLNISTQTLNDWIYNDKLCLPFKKIGKVYRFNRLELDRFMTTNKQQCSGKHWRGDGYY